MKKVSTAAAEQSRNFSQPKLTIGLDLGDRSSYYCVVDESRAHGGRAKDVHHAQSAASSVWSDTAQPCCTRECGWKGGDSVMTRREKDLV